MDIVSLIIQGLSGAVGGSIVGNVARNLNLGPVGNSLVGIIGGVLGGQLLAPVFGLESAALVSGALDPMALVGQIATAGASGGVLVAIAGLLKQMMEK